MNWIQKIWYRIVSSNDEPYIQKINTLSSDLKITKSNLDKCDKALTKATSENSKLQAEFDKLQTEYRVVLDKNKKLNDRLKALEIVEPPYKIPTDIIDTSKFAYLPYTLIYYWNPATKKIASRKLQVTVSKFYRMWTDEMYKYFRNAIKDCKTFDEKVIKLRDVITSRTTYKYDLSGNGLHAGENWRYPTETFYGRIGDCEDSTSLWVTACHICGLPADRVFNATGEYRLGNNTAGHSFGIAKFDDGKWYVIETTSIIPKQLLKGHPNYFITGFLNGLSNWALSGQAKKEQF